MRPIWSGTISFGLVNIPVKLISAVQSEEIDFDLLTKDEHHPVRYARMDSKTGEEVEWKDIVKGFQYAKGKYVVVENEDFERARPEAARSIDLVQFAKEADIDPLYFDKPYYLEAAKGGEKGYRLLARALKQTGTVGLGEFMLRNRVHLCALKAQGELLILQQMRYADALREAPEVPKAAAAKVNNREVELAVKLVQQLTAPFEPSDFRDEYIAALKKVIKAKAAGKSIRIAEPRKAEATVKDLMAVLKESISMPRKRA